MYRRLPILSGLSILAVVINHAGGWGLVAMFWWSHRYRAVGVPNFDQMGSPTYYFFDAIHLSTVFAVQAFLFISGFFIAYAARSGSGTVRWKTIRARVLALLVPYLVWTIIVLVQDYLLGEPHTPKQILLEVLLFGANGGYFFIPVLIQFYLLSPWIVGAARRNPRGLILAAVLIMLIPILFRYARLLGEPAFLKILINATPDQLLIRWAVYFPLGVVAGLYAPAFQDWLTRHSVALLTVTILSYILYFVEVQLHYQLSADHWRPGPSSIFYHSFGLAFTLTFLAYPGQKILAARWLSQLGSRSYGIYLTHFSFMTITAKLLYHLFPWVLSQQFLFQPLVFLAGLVLPLMVMAFMARTSLRRFYPYVFG